MTNVANSFNTYPMTGDNAWLAGETEEFVLTLTDDSGDPLDWTTLAEVVITVRRFPGDPSIPLLQLTCHPNVSLVGVGITGRDQVDPNIGVGDVTASATQTDAIGPGRFSYDVRVTKIGGSEKYAIWPSDLEVVDPVTRLADG